MSVSIFTVFLLLFPVHMGFLSLLSSMWLIQYPKFMTRKYSGHILHRVGWFIEGDLSQSWVKNYSVIRAMAELVPNSTVNASTAAGTKGQQHRSNKANKSILRHINYIAKKGGESNLTTPGFIDVVALGTGAAGNTRSVLLDMTYFKYLFNCGEGTQRTGTEHKMRISKIKDIFITHKSWANTGGLLGMALSLGDMGLPSIRIHGPPNIEKMLTIPKGFSALTLQVDKREISEGPYEDSAMKIDCIPIYPKYQDIEDTEPASKRRRRNDDDMSVIYYCQPIKKLRSLDFNKAINLGVPRGPALGKLKSGETFTLADGRTITPDQVLSDHEVIPPLLVLDVPTAHYLESFVSNQTLRDIQQKAPEEVPQLIVHFSPPEVMQHQEYQLWMDAFPASTRHLVLNSGGSVVSQLAPYEVQARLNLIHPGIFPLLPHQDKEMEQLAEIVPDQRVVPGRVCLRYSVRSGTSIKRGFYTDNCADINNDAYIAETEGNADFQAALVTTKEQLESASKQGSPGGEYPEVLFLGTGSAMPNKIRNVSAILLHTSASQCMLLDVGEGTYGQLCHHYGKETPAVLRRLDSVFISHLHSDHHMGLIGVIEAREVAFESVGQVAPPLTVIVTQNYRKFITQIDQYILPVIEKIKHVPVEWFGINDRSTENAATCEQVIKTLRLRELKFCWMWHRQFPFGIAMTHKAGWKLAYSGDTMPCDEFVKIGKDCDVLIHEATMEDELEEDALIKKHSTTSQAIDVGMRMQAKFILLTHFSQRYAKVPRMSPNLTDKVGIAFDNMKVRLRDLPLLPLLLPALQTLFVDDLQELDKRAEKRLLNKESRKLLRQEAWEAQQKAKNVENVESQTGSSKSIIDDLNSLKEKSKFQTEHT